MRSAISDEVRNSGSRKVGEMTRDLSFRASSEWLPSNWVEADIFLSDARQHLMNRDCKGDTLQARFVILDARKLIYREGWPA